MEAGRLVMRLPQGSPARLSELGPWGFRRVSLVDGADRMW